MKELMYFVVGAAVGATVALLMAPEKGDVVRANIRRAVDEDLDIGREVVGVVQEAVAETAKEIKETIKGKR